MPLIFRIKVADPSELEEPSSALEDAAGPLRFRAPDGSWFLCEADLSLARQRGLRPEILETIDEADLPVRIILPHDGGVNNPPPAGARLSVLARLLAEQRANGDVHVRFLGRNRTPPPDGFVLDRADGQRRYVWQVVPAEQVENRPELSERFSALRELFSDEHTRVVLSLGSGGLKLFAKTKKVIALSAAEAAKFKAIADKVVIGTLAGLEKQGIAGHRIYKAMRATN